jgi:hypothetical protein
MTELVTIHACPNYGALFGGSNLTYRDTDEGIQVLCPVCEEWHNLTEIDNMEEIFNYGRC